jgi:hypothetical protein
MLPDWTVALDDMQVERHRTCVRCGKIAQRMDIRVVAGLALFACLCQRCYTAHGWQAVDALLAQRARGVVRANSANTLFTSVRS